MTKAQRMRRREHSAPAGPRNCMRTNGNPRACEKCGCTPTVLHVPIRAAGRYCATCCPHCSPVAPKEQDTNEAA